MLSVRDDPELLRAYREGRREAFERIYRAYVRIVDRQLGALARAGGHPTLAQPSAIADLLQEVIVRAFSPSARRGYDGLRDFGPYLTTIARNCFVDTLRVQGREVPKDPNELAVVVDDDPAGSGAPDGWCDAKTLGVLTEFVKGLPADLQGIYQQRFVLGQSQEQASAELGLSRRAIRTGESRLRKGLRKALVQAGIRLTEISGDDADSPARIPGSAVWDKTGS